MVHTLLCTIELSGSVNERCSQSCEYKELGCLLLMWNAGTCIYVYTYVCMYVVKDGSPQVMMDDDAGQVLDCPSCGVKVCM